MSVDLNNNKTLRILNKRIIVDSGTSFFLMPSYDLLILIKFIEQN